MISPVLQRSKFRLEGKLLFLPISALLYPKILMHESASRSGLAYSIDVGEEIINADYRGSLVVILNNNSDLDFFVKPGDLIAQLIIHKIETPDAVETKNLDSTIRGAGGFGSTGLLNFHLSCTLRPQNPKRAYPSSFISLPGQSNMAENSEIHEQSLPVQNSMAGKIHKPFCKIAILSEEAPLNLSFFKVKKLSFNAILPSRCSSLSAGYDLSSASDVKVPARGRALIPTDLSIAIPKNTYAQIVSFISKRDYLCSVAEILKPYMIFPIQLFNHVCYTNSTCKRAKQKLKQVNYANFITVRFGLLCKPLPRLIALTNMVSASMKIINDARPSSTISFLTMC